MIKAVLLDVGGPILDEDQEYAAWDRFLSRYLGIPEGEVRRTAEGYIRRGVSQAWLAVLWHYLRPDVARFREAKERFRAFQREFIATKEHRVREGVREAIAALRREGYLLALAANQGARTGEFLRRSGITRGFAWDMVSEEMGIEKPAPLFFRMILEGIGVRPQEAVMVGDRLDNDIFPAKLLGMRTVQVLVGPYREQVPTSPLHHPDRTVTGLGELPGVLRDLG